MLPTLKRYIMFPFRFNASGLFREELDTLRAKVKLSLFPKLLIFEILSLRVVRAWALYNNSHLLSQSQRLPFLSPVFASIDRHSSSGLKALARFVSWCTNVPMLSGGKGKLSSCFVKAQHSLFMQE
jgi:hypothetical protein